MNRLNAVFDEYLGFNDDVLALTVLDIGRDCKSLIEMEERVREVSSELYRRFFRRDRKMFRGGVEGWAFKSFLYES